MSPAVIALAILACLVLLGSGGYLAQDLLELARARMNGCQCDRINGDWWYLPNCPVHKDNYRKLP